MKGRIIVSTLLALLLFVSLPMSALAAEWDIGKGDITVNAGSGGQTVTQGGGAAIPDSAPVITGSSKENNVTINAEKDQTANVTLSGVNIDVRDKGKAAVSTAGEGNVSIELNGESTLRSGYEHAGLEKNNGGSLTIADEDKNGKLTAWGGQQGAGIGGGSGKDGSNIFSRFSNCRIFFFPSSISAVNSSRVFSLGFVIAGRSFLPVGIEKGQSIFSAALSI